MGWNELAGNRAVSGDNLVGSGIIAKPGQILPTGQKAITRAQANAWLNVQQVPDDNKLVLKQELVAAPTLVLIANNASTGTSSGAACGLASDGHISIYSEDGTWDVGNALFSDAYGYFSSALPDGFYAFVKDGISYWVETYSLSLGGQALPGFVKTKGVCTPKQINKITLWEDIQRLLNPRISYVNVRKELVPSSSTLTVVVKNKIDNNTYNFVIPAGTRVAARGPQLNGLPDLDNYIIISCTPTSDDTYTYTF